MTQSQNTRRVVVDPLTRVEGHLRVQAVLNENKEMLVLFLNERLPKVRPVELEGTYLQWLDFRAYGWDTKEQERIMQQEAQLFFDEGYRFGEEGEGFERMNLACPKAVLLKALERLETVLRRYE